MPIVCGIKFRGTGKVYYFAPGDLQSLQVGDHVIVETARGREMGQVAVEIREVDEAEIVGQLKPIVRRAGTADLLDAQRYQRQEDEAVAKCREQVARFDLPMKMVSAEYSYDGSRLTFFFTSDQRVDFRELVRELARIFRVRIELRQIGVRDEAKFVGGVGKCGRSLCCATWLNDFCPVSIRMAKQQDLPLSPMEISGLCGRLLCCLGYENDYYQTVKGRFPKVGKIVATPMGQAKVIGVSALRETVALLFDDGSTMELTADELSGKVPIRREETDDLSEDQARALDTAISEEVASDGNGHAPAAQRRYVAEVNTPSSDDVREEPRPPRNRPPRERPAAPRQETPQAPAEGVGREGRESAGEPSAAPAGTSSGRSRRRRSRRPRGERPGDTQGATAAPAQEGARTDAQGASQPSGDGQGRATGSSRRRPRRRRPQQPKANQGEAPSSS